MRHWWGTRVGFFPSSEAVQHLRELLTPTSQRVQLAQFSSDDMLQHSIEKWMQETVGGGGACQCSPLRTVGLRIRTCGAIVEGDLAQHVAAHSVHHTALCRWSRVAGQAQFRLCPGIDRYD
jgi:hypothetical protein